MDDYDSLVVTKQNPNEKYVALRPAHPCDISPCVRRIPAKPFRLYNRGLCDACQGYRCTTGVIMLGERFWKSSRLS
jgi:hypothetical protein